MDYVLITSGISFLGASFILLRRVHENRIVGVPGDHKYDAYWPFNVIWNYTYKKIKGVVVSLKEIIAPHLAKGLANFASKFYKITSSVSHEILHISNLVHGKGSLKKNTGTTSLFIRDISDYKKNNIVN